MFTPIILDCPQCQGETQTLGVAIDKGMSLLIEAQCIDCETFCVGEIPLLELFVKVEA